MPTFSEVKSLALSLVLAAQPLGGTELITLGDSLTFAYEASFGFELSIPFGPTYGDGMDPNEVKNWAEILDQERSNHFDLGERQSIQIPLGLFDYDLYLRQKKNWAIPGLKIDQLRRFMTSEAGFLELLAESPDFGPLSVLFSLTSVDFAIEDLETQITNSTGRLVFFIGGNDIDSIYGTVYDGGDPGTFIADYLDDATVILDRVLELNPNLPIVLVNVPHVGITPMVKSERPTDPVKTTRATNFLRLLMSELAQLARSRNVGYADIFSATLPMLSNDPLSVYGIPFSNIGSTTGDLDFVWLNGPYSTNFHPNTSGQALIANEIVCAFNEHYDAGIPALTATEILTNLLGRTSSQVDMDFPTWASSYTLPSLSEQDDSDQDGFPAALEFALGLNPLLKDSHKVRCSTEPHNGQPHLTLAYPQRLPSSTHVTLLPMTTTDLSTPFQALPLPPIESDGLFRAQIPHTPNKGFLRLEAVVE
ncbi:MAG: SGNH/GDSL hydrolase family protein [Roseibacillus sp.]